MNHCMFENTYRDLVQCFDALDDAGSVDALIASKSPSDKPYVKKLISLCVEIRNAYLSEVAS